MSRLRFTIRDLLWLTLVVALTVGSWVDRSRLAGPAAEAPSLKQSLSDKKKENDRLVHRIVELENITGRPHSASEVIKEFRGDNPEPR